MLTHEQNELLCRVGPGTAMGRVLENYWFPVLLSDELVGADRTPKRVDLLGRTFVAFRTSDGRVSILDEHCPHRGSSLVLGHVEDCAIRCLYHGWAIDADGMVIDTPTEPENSRLAGHVRTSSYPVHESGGMIWVHVGDRSRADVAPTFEWDSLDAGAGARHQAHPAQQLAADSRELARQRPRRDPPPGLHHRRRCGAGG